MRVGLGFQSEPFHRGIQPDSKPRINHQLKDKMAPHSQGFGFFRGVLAQENSTCKELTNINFTLNWCHPLGLDVCMNCIATSNSLETSRPDFWQPKFLALCWFLTHYTLKCVTCGGMGIFFSTVPRGCETSGPGLKIRVEVHRKLRSELLPPSKCASAQEVTSKVGSADSWGVAAFTSAGFYGGLGWMAKYGKHQLEQTKLDSLASTQ